MRGARILILTIGVFPLVLVTISGFVSIPFFDARVSNIDAQIEVDVSSNLNPTPAVGMFVGGSNYVMISIGNYKNDCQGWYHGELKPVIGFYHEEQQKVREQLQLMYDGGQRRVVLFLWYMHFGNYPNLIGKSIYGHVLKSDGANLAPQHQENLRNLIRDIKAVGYKEVIFRFGAQGVSGPEGWARWDESMYQENWNFILNTRKIVNKAWCGNENTCNGEGLLYDLGAELAGAEVGQAVSYTERLWRNYVYDAGLGKKDTIGFSFAAPGFAGRINKMLDVYDSGPAGRPNIYAFDFYDDSENQFKEVHNALAQRGEASKPLIILESYYNDEIEREELRGAIQSTGRKVLFLAQWPWVRNSLCPHFSVDYPKDYSNYLKKPLLINLKTGWNKIIWPDVSGKKASDIPVGCPIAVTKENFWFKPYVRNFGGVNFNFEKDKVYYINCNQETVWQL